MANNSWHEPSQWDYQYQNPGARYNSLYLDERLYGMPPPLPPPPPSPPSQSQFPLPRPSLSTAAFEAPTSVLASPVPSLLVGISTSQPAPAMMDWTPAFSQHPSRPQSALQSLSPQVSASRAPTQSASPSESAPLIAPLTAPQATASSSSPAQAPMVTIQPPTLP